MLRCVNNGVMTIKPGHQTNGNKHVMWLNKSSFMPFPTSGSVYVWRTPKEAYNLECLVPTVKHCVCVGEGGRFCDGLGSSVVVQYSVGPIITLHGRITAREYVDRLGNPDAISKNNAIFPYDNAPINTAVTVQCHGLKSMKVNFNIFPGQHNHQI
jgi:hypothetical protein